MKKHLSRLMGFTLVLIMAMSMSLQSGYCKTYKWTPEGPMNKVALPSEDTLKDVIKDGQKGIPSEPLVLPYGSEQLIVTWKPVENATSYRVYEKNPKGSFRLVAETDSCQYISPKLKKDLVYYYRISAVVNGIEGKKSNWVSSVTKNSKKNNGSLEAYRSFYSIVETGREGVYLATLNTMMKNYDCVCWNSVPFGVRVKGKNLVSKRIRIINDNPEIIRLGITTKSTYEVNKYHRKSYDETNGIVIKDVLSKVYGKHKVGDVVSLRFMAHNGKMITIKYLLVIDRIEGGLTGNIHEYKIKAEKYAYDDYKNNRDVIVRR